MNIIRIILIDHFRKMIINGVKFRDTVIENVKKFVNCGKNGYATFFCENCGKFEHINFRCKSRFCTTCGNRYNIERTDVMAHKILDVPHRHCVFTIPDTLRIFFRADWDLHNCLFAAVSECIYRQFNGKTPAFICVLHTFGRDLKFNPHIHVVLAEGSADKLDNWHKKGYFDYESLRKSFRTILLKLMLEKLGASFKEVVDECYKSAQNGFYVNAPQSKGKIRNLINYIGRYLGRPAIAKSRIVHYDGNNVTFRYERHEDGSLVHETISADDFIKRLVVHIPPKYFNMIRFYGLYALPKMRLNKVDKVIKTNRAKLSFSELLLKTFGVDPHRCKLCGQRLSFAWLNFTPDKEIRFGGSRAPPNHTAVSLFP